MTLPGAPLPPRSCLDRGMRSATTMPEMEALRRRVWQQQGVVSLHLEDITDAWSPSWCRASPACDGPFALWRARAKHDAAS